MLSPREFAGVTAGAFPAAGQGFNTLILVLDGCDSACRAVLSCVRHGTMLFDRCDQHAVPLLCVANCTPYCCAGLHLPHQHAAAAQEFRGHCWRQQPLLLSMPCRSGPPVCPYARRRSAAIRRQTQSKACCFPRGVQFLQIGWQRQVQRHAGLEAGCLCSQHCALP